MIELRFDGPINTKITLALTHGRDLGIDSEFLTFFTEAVAKHGVRVARFEFPYMARDRNTAQKTPDSKEVLCNMWHMVVKHLGDSGLVLGGKSLGGFIASMVADELGAGKLLCLGFPFHQEGNPAKPTKHSLQAMNTRTLILQGGDDEFGKRPEVGSYGLSPNVQVNWIDGCNHDFMPASNSGRTKEACWAEVVDKSVAFLFP